MELKVYYLYTIMDTLNNKVYVGQTVRPKERWSQHKAYAKMEQPVQYVHRAMAKYNIDNFVFETIACCITQEDADMLEKLLIQQYNSRDSEKGYNVAPGGDPAWNRGLPKEQQPMYGKKQSEYFKKRMLEVHIGSTFNHTPETKQKMSKTRKGRTKSKEWAQKIGDAHRGKTVSEESRQKQSVARRGLRNAAKLTWDIVCNIREEYALGDISQRKLAQKYNTTQTNIRYILTGKTWIKEKL